MSNRKARLDRALEQARALAEARRRRANPTLECPWLPVVQDRWKAALGQFDQMAGGVSQSHSEQEGTAICDAVEQLVSEYWRQVLHLAASAHERPVPVSYYCRWVTAYIPMIAKWLGHVPAHLMAPSLELLVRYERTGGRDKASDLLATWLRGLAHGNVELPAVSPAAMGMVLGLILGRGNEVDLAYCGRCHFAAPLLGFDAAFASCPHCSLDGRYWVYSHGLKPVSAGVEQAAPKNERGTDCSTVP